MGFPSLLGVMGRIAVAAALSMLGAVALSALAQEPSPTVRPSTARVTKVKPQAKPPLAVATAEPSDFTIGRPPGWVQPLTADTSIAIPPAPVQVLLVDRQTRVEVGNTVHFMHFIRQVNDAAGLQKGAQIEVEFDPTYQKLVLHQLDLWRGAQRIDKLDRKIVKVLHRETQLERQMVDGRMTASIVLDDLRVGDRIEWAVSLVGENPVFGGRFVDVEWAKATLGPIGLLQVRLLAAAQRNIRYRVGEPTVEVDSRLQDGWRETTFRRRAAPQFHYDQHVPSSVFLKDQIEFSEFADWAEVAGWAEQLFARSMQSSVAVDARVAEIQAQAATPAERLRVALDFVQQDIRYFGTEIGPDSHQPASADTVLRQRFGDCKDKVALLGALLTRLGFEATPVLASMSYREQVQSRLPSPLAFDHVIAGVMVDGKMQWLDGTRSQQTGAPANRQSVGLGFGLLARAGTATLSALPAARDALRAETVDTFSFPKIALEGSLESVTVYHGDMAEWLREVRSSLPAADFEKLAIGETMRLYPNLVVSAPLQVEQLVERNALKITQLYKTGNYWRFPEQRMLVGDFALGSLIAPLRLPDQTPRTDPLRINLPGRYLHKVRFVFDEELYGQSSSNRFDESNGYFELHIRYDGQRKEQTIDGELRQVADAIDAGEWARYRDQLTKIWPRLASVVTVPTVSPQDAEAIRAELTALNESVRRGDLKVVTREQVTARARLIQLDKQLAAGRLAPKLRAEALVAQGVQLDHLGRLEEAQTAFRKAIDLDKANAEAYSALAVNSLFRRQNAEAVEHATQALLLSPASVETRYTRAWARYFSGELAQASDELKEILQSRNEVERGYGAVWLYLTTRRMGGDGTAATQAYASTASKPGWPHPVMQLMNGQIDFDAALAATRENDQPNRGRECELYFYAAQKALLDLDTAKARTYLQKSVATGVVEFNEHSMAQRELERIGAR